MIFKRKTPALTHDTRPVLLLTTGDPAGIGPEISLHAAGHPAVREQVRLVLVGDAVVLEQARQWVHADLPLRIAAADGGLGPLLEPSQVPAIDVLDLGLLSKPVPLGVAAAQGGRASYSYIQKAIDLCLEGTAQGVVTAPINKRALNLAGIDFPGHTEIFAERTRSPANAMLMYSDRLAVGLATCHQSLASVPASLTTERIVEVGQLLHAALLRIRGVAPHIAVLGLNPHAGEHGLFGDEEKRIVAPAVEALMRQGVRVTGPLPPDTAFTPAALERYDAHLCLYHDQGLIPFKMLCFDHGVNVTMGLPFPRTSVDHGTAYDLAGLGVAEVSSLLAAINLGARLTQSSAL